MNQPKKIWEKEGGLSPLVAFVKYFYPVSEDAIAYINQHSFVKRAERNEYLLREGEVCKYLYFICKGVIRGYIKNGSKEITTWITAENELVSSIRGFDLQQPSLENIQAIEDCELVVADYDALQYLYENHLEMNIVGRKLLQQYYRDAEERAFISRIPNAGKRYLHFLDTKPSLANRIPLKYIASYLGMTIETLSRIRSARPKTK
ncbi:MAG: Crp/Fnr family transcriptional regulator [Ferruginibacter sp.]|nr:Crp/Fnr family transcriptional regulator [Chitinophagaceae bacterium]